jgi:uncharacterized protein involved in outer membrane biogenesis
MAAGGADTPGIGPVVRILAVIAVFVAGALIAGLALVPRLVTWNDYRDELTRQAEAITGQKVAIGGRIDLELLPRPTLTLAHATLSTPSTAGAGSSPSTTPGTRSLVVDRLDLRLKPLPLLRGQLAVDSVRLVRPVLRVEAPHATRASALLLAGGGMLLPIGSNGPSELTVVDGRALVGGGDHAALHSIEAINFQVGSEGSSGPYTLDGEFTIADQKFGITGRLGQFHPDSWSTLQLGVTAPEAGSTPTVLSFRGLTWSNLAIPRLRGDLSLSGSSARAGLDALDRALGDAPKGELPALPDWLAAPFHLTGHLDFVNREAKVDQLQVTLADTQGTGSLAVGLSAPRPEIDLELDLPHLAVADAWPEDAAGLAPLAALAGLKGRIDLSVEALDYRGGTIHGLRTTLELTGSGQMTVEQARAILPGQTSVNFTGALAGRGANALLQGSLAVVSDDLGKLLAWAGLQPHGLAAGQLRTLSLDSRLAMDASTLRFTQAELRVDASRLSGSLALSRGARPQVAGALTLDRLDLDSYLPDGQAAQLVAGGLQAFDDLDLALQARIERLTWHGFRLEEVTLDGRSVAGQLTLNELSARDSDNSKAKLRGTLDLERRTFDLSGAGETARPLQLLRGLGLTPPLMLARLTPLSVSGSAKGDLQAVDLALELRHDDARLAVKGQIRSPPQGPVSYALAVAGSDPDYRQLLDQMGIVAAPAGTAAAPFDLTAKLTGDLTSRSTVAGTAQIGAMSLTGHVDWQSGTPRPKLVIRLSAGEPNADDLMSLAAIAALRLDPIVTEGPQPGDWSTRPLAFGWLDAADAEVDLSSKGGLAGPGVELKARLDKGRLMIDRLSATLWNGQLNAQISLDGARTLPFMALALDLRAVDATALTAWLDLPPAIEGKADLYVDATSAGDNPHDLVRGLIGNGKIALHDGHLVGADLARLAGSHAPALASAPASASDAATTDDSGIDAAPAVAVPDLGGSFALKRGIATAQTVRLKLADTPVKLEGTVDLLLWAADLTLSADAVGGPDDGALELRLVGPLDDPQLRLREPAASVRPEQAP